MYVESCERTSTEQPSMDCKLEMHTSHTLASLQACFKTASRQSFQILQDGGLTSECPHREEPDMLEHCLNCDSIRMQSLPHSSQYIGDENMLNFQR